MIHVPEYVTEAIRAVLTLRTPMTPEQLDKAVKHALSNPDDVIYQLTETADPYDTYTVIRYLSNQDL